jgi:ABC-type multidrug transport system fused ATPase/permease subunit
MSRQYTRAYFGSQIFSVAMRFGLEVTAILFIAAFLAITLIVYGHSTARALVFLAVFYRLAPQLLKVQDAFFQSTIYLPWFHTYSQRLQIASTAEERHEGTEQISTFSGLRFRDVGMVYPDRQAPVLDAVDLHIGPGECVAIVGRSGSGKSTMVDLVTGLLTPTRGQVEVNGIDLRRIDRDFWRERIGLVLQDSPLFHGTVLENIAWGERAVDRGRAEAAAKLAHAWEYISKLPSGLDSSIGEKGGVLSGGQRQRLALARALYRDPLLLILDEATSALDSHAEAAVQEALRGIKGSCAVLMIAHKIKSTEIADRIVVLEDGRIAEEGSWSELMQSPAGSFRRLLELQAVGVRQEAVATGSTVDSPSVELSDPSHS